MRRIELQSLTLRNFMGLRDMTIEPHGANTTIFGANGVGKTTIASAYSWLLFEKDSTGRKDFDIKTLDSSGTAVSAVDHEVEGVFIIDGQELTLRRVYAEKWTKPRGSAHKELTGHETSHYIDGVPVNKGEFTAKVSDILDEPTWRLLSDPAAFRALHWKDRRNVVLEVTGDVSDADVIASDSALADLPGILGKRTLDEHRKVVASRRTQLNKELAELPARIDEVQRGLPEEPADSAEQLADSLAALREAHAAVAERLAAAKAGAGDSVTERKALREVESKLSDLDMAARREHQDAVSNAQRAAALAQQAMDDADADLKRHQRAEATSVADIAQLDTKLVALRDDWAVIGARQVEAHVDGVCAACQQELPAHQVEAAHEKAIADLNARKARELEGIQQEGNSLRARRDTEASELAKTQASIEQLQADLARLQADAEKAQDAAKAAASTSQADVSTSKPYIALARERDQLTATIQSIESGDGSAIEALQQELQEASEAVSSTERLASIWGLRAAGEARTVELKGQERALSAEFEDLERQLFLMDEFTRTKVALLESRVASVFNLVSFRLFKPLVNGGLEECCDATVNGVPFDSVNHAGQIAAGLDIIRTLQKHHQVQTPILIDQAESITDIPETGAQQIALIVSELDWQLRVELGKEQVAA